MHPPAHRQRLVFHKPGIVYVINYVQSFSLHYVGLVMTHLACNVDYPLACFITLDNVL